MAQQAQRRTRTATPQRWAKAAQRAISEGVQVRQLAGSGAWVANSGTDATVAYEIAVTGNIAHGCTCLAGLNDDPVCKHRAAFYLLIGALALDPEPDPPAPANVVCFRCQGRDVGCPVCAGGGIAPLAAQAAALVTASVGACDHCGGPLDDDTERDDALEWVCGACVEAERAAACAARQAAISAAHALAVWERMQAAADALAA